MTEFLWGLRLAVALLLIPCLTGCEPPTQGRDQYDGIGGNDLAFTPIGPAFEKVKVGDIVFAPVLGKRSGRLVAEFYTVRHSHNDEKRQPVLLNDLNVMVKLESQPEPFLLRIQSESPFLEEGTNKGQTWDGRFWVPLCIRPLSGDEIAGFIIVYRGEKGLAQKVCSCAGSPTSPQENPTTSD